MAAKARFVVAPIEFTYLADHVVYDTDRLHERNAVCLRRIAEANVGDAVTRRHLLVQLLLARRFEEMETLLGQDSSEPTAQDIDAPTFWSMLIAFAREDMSTARRFALFVVRQYPKSGISHLLLAKAQLSASDVKAFSYHLREGGCVRFFARYVANADGATRVRTLASERDVPPLRSERTDEIGEGGDGRTKR